MLDSSINNAVKSVVDSVDFNKVSDLTKEQFSQILSKSIYKSITSSDFITKISRELAFKIK